MNTAVEIFKPGLAELRSLADRLKDIKIKDVGDVEGYAAAKEAKKELAQWRIDITKAGKKFREEALAYQREVIRQEKEHLEIITPVEDGIKAMLTAVDEAKAREERKILIPARRTMLAEIEIEMTDEELLAYDEVAFSGMFTEKKMAYLEAREAKRRAEEEEKRRAEELERAKAEAAAKAVEEEKARAEREKKAEEERIAREEAAKKAEAERIEKEKADELAKAEKNRKYKAWLKEHDVNTSDPIAMNDVKIERVGTTFVLWKKVSEIEIS